jgi:fumarylacetoacetase
MEDVEMQLPLMVITLILFSKTYHQCGKMFRDPENALLPNWLHIP